MVHTRAETRRLEEAKTKFLDIARTRKKSPSLPDLLPPPPDFVSFPEQDNYWGRSDFLVLKILGQGGFGQVMKAREKESGHIVALKKIQVSSTYRYRMCQRELEINQSVQHPGIVATYGHFFAMTPRLYSSDTSDSDDDSDEDSADDFVVGGSNLFIRTDDDHIMTVYLILEYCPNGDLSSLIELYEDDDESTKPIGDKRASRYCAELADAVEYLHSRRIMHRDIKTCNILLSENFKPKLADFGLSIHGSYRCSCVGTPKYMAPEIVYNELIDYQYDDKVDSWSLGILAFVLLVGEAPFHLQIINGNVWIPELRFPTAVSKEAQDFIRKLLIADPTKRMPLKDARSHPWVTKHSDVKK